MAFNPPSDVVLEVLNAADPARASLAAERLAALAGASTPPGDFAADLARAAAASAGGSGPGLADARSRLAALSDPADAAARVKREFEATMLSSLIDELMPKNASVFGEGSAGDMWRSMFSEQIAGQLARSGALGLSRKLFATHDIAAHEAKRGGEAGAATTAAMSANILSAPNAALIDNGAVLFSRRRSP